MRQVQDRRLSLIERALEQMNRGPSPRSEEHSLPSKPACYRLDPSLSLSVALLLREGALHGAVEAIRAVGTPVRGGSDDVSGPLLGELLPFLENLGCPFPEGHAPPNEHFLTVLSPEEVDSARERLRKLQEVLTDDDLDDGMGLVLYLAQPDAVRAGLRHLLEEAMSVPGTGLAVFYC